jgi:hypothetical protein
MVVSFSLFYAVAADSQPACSGTWRQWEPTVRSTSASIRRAMACRLPNKLEPANPGEHGPRLPGRAQGDSARTLHPEKLAVGQSGAGARDHLGPVGAPRIAGAASVGIARVERFPPGIDHLRAHRAVIFARPQRRKVVRRQCEWTQHERSAPDHQDSNGNAIQEIGHFNFRGLNNAINTAITNSIGFCEISPGIRCGDEPIDFPTRSLAIRTCAAV